uniref:NADH-ubiquinone oxidoreductase chain 2 n=1 Tax=Tessmannella kiplingi TaxID=2943473 RepID=A0A9E8GBH5_9HYME|nr:NADH dehydrogenase subunit 2 [Tessmannella kiplingi]
MKIFTNNMNTMIFLTLMMLSIMIGLMTNSFIYIWICLEINMMSFIPLTIFNNKKFNDTAMKYFIIQSLGSSLYLYFMLISMIYSKNYSIFWMIIMSLLIKMGMFPFYLWYINIIKKMSWFNNFLLLTFQKILPLYIMNMMMSNLMSPNNFLIFQIYFILILFNAIFSIMMIYKINSIKILLTLSSLNHMSWLMYIINYNLKMFTFYYLIYSLTLFNLTYIFLFFKMKNLNNLYTMNNMNFKIYLIILMMTLMSFPPLFGFFTKSYSTMLFIQNNSLYLIYMLMLTSIIMTFFYFKIFIPSIMINLKNFKNNNKFKNNNFFKKIIILNIIFISIMTIFYWMMS